MEITNAGRGVHNRLHSAAVIGRDFIALDLVKRAVAARDQKEPAKAIGMLREAHGLTTCASTIAAIDKAIADIHAAAAPIPEEKIATTTPDCQRLYGGGCRAGAPMPDPGRFYCLPDQAMANARCSELNKGPGCRLMSVVRQA